MLTERQQKLLEEIASYFETEDEVRKDPDFCLDAMLEEISEHLARQKKTGSPRILHTTLRDALGKGALSWRRREEKEKQIA